MPVNWPNSGRVPANAMEYVRQIRAFTAFSQLFDFKAESVRVDNILFRLHSNVTVMILLVGTMFVTMRQYFGEPIECMQRQSDISPAMLQHYCWLEATFSVSDSSHKLVGVEVAYPGVKTLNPLEGERKVYHKYYQWVYFVLLLQAMLFAVPKHIWKVKESKRLRKLITELKQRHILEMTEYDSKRLIQDVADSLLISNDYFFFFFFCEIVYFIHLLVQIWFTNMFLGGSFLSLGKEWLQYNHQDYDNRYDPLIRVFPRMTKCVFHKYGYSGAIEKHDALCFLPLNIVNEKIYIVLWFWFLSLLIVTIVVLIHRVVLLLCPPLRYFKLKRLAPSTDKKYLKRLTSRVGNWFILHFIANNMKPSHFRDLINEVMKHHFDQNGKPLYSGSSSKLKKAVANGLSGVQSVAPSAPSKGKDSDKKSKKSKNKLESIGFTAPAPNIGFVINRDPPSGHSADSEDWDVGTCNDPGNNYTAPAYPNEGNVPWPDEQWA
jgi:hypothetical protein